VEGGSGAAGALLQPLVDKSALLRKKGVDKKN